MATACTSFQENWICYIIASFSVYISSLQSGVRHWLSFIFTGKKPCVQKLKLILHHRRSNQDASSRSGWFVYSQISFLKWWLMCNIPRNMCLVHCFPSTAFHPGSCNSHHTSSFHLPVIALSIQQRRKKNPTQNELPCIVHAQLI